MGNLILAYIDKDENFRYAGRVGTGFKHSDREEWLSWALKNKASGPEKSRLIWTKPIRVVEIQSEELRIQNTALYAYDEAYGRYSQIGKAKSAIGRKPVFIRIREDKKPTPHDVRLEQIPGFKDG